MHARRNQVLAHQPRDPVRRLLPTPEAFDNRRQYIENAVDVTGVV
jgi:hypothetical protein